MEIKAQLNYLRMSPRKVRLAANLIKGMPVSRAELELHSLVKYASLPLLKLLKSAITNAKYNFQIDLQDLYIKDIKVNPGPMLKRSRPRAFGRSAIIRKRTSHVSMVLDSAEKSSFSQMRHIKKEGPAIREAGEEKIREEIEESRQGGKREKKNTFPKKVSGAVRRMFRRKVI